jgi:hypothetical protein
VSAWHRPNVESAALEHLAAVVGPVSARQIVAGLLARGATRGRVSGLREAAAIVDNDDYCDCGGCDTCVPRRLAAQVRDRADLLAGAGS